MLTLQRLAPGSKGGPLILTVDFALFSSGPTLGSVLTRAEGSHQVLRVDAISDLSRMYGFQSLSELASGYANALATSGDRVDLVAAHCSGAAMATHLACALECIGLDPPAVVLVSPTWPTLADVSEELKWLRLRLQATASVAGKIEMSDDMDDVLHRIDQTLRSDANEMCRARGLEAKEGAVIADQLVARYRGWLSFLLATALSGAVTPRGILQVVSGRQQPEPMPSLMQLAQVRRVPIDDTQLLAVEELPQWLLALCKA